MDHIRLTASHDDVDRRKFYFDAIRLKHRALPEINLDDVDTSTEFMGKTLSFPLIISSMTGGTQDGILRINRNLAEAAEKTGVAMGVGSQRVMFDETAAKKSFDLRPFAPNTVLCANVGAVQLNYGFDREQCEKMIEVLQADAIYFHLNAVQEAVQPEGNTRFSGLADKLGEMAGTLSVPVIVKEVGAGLGRDDVLVLIEKGVQFVDVAGAGGTSWSRIESYRDEELRGAATGLLFQDWGHPTPDALNQISDLRERVTIISSGGIRSGVDMAKAMILGAGLCGIARPFLQPAMESVDAVVSYIEQLEREFRTALFLLGKSRVDELIGNKALILNWNQGAEPNRYSGNNV